MSRSRGSSQLLANPVLVGAITVLVTVVAVFLSYNANRGLPFVPTKALKARVASGANLVPGNEVRSGGARVGLIQDMKPVRLPDGSTGAELDLKLDQVIGDIPDDSVVTIRARSALGLKYLDLREGVSKRPFEEGDTIPLADDNPPIELDDVLSTFDRETRDGQRKTLRGAGDTLAARGPSLNATIEALPPLLDVLEPVMRNLGARETGLEEFFGELGDAARVVAPLADRQAELFTHMADTFEAFSRDERALQETISESPRTLRVGTSSLRVQRPFLTDLAAFSRETRQAAATLRTALPTVNRALAAGIPAQIRAARELNPKLRDTLRATRRLTEAPSTNAAVRGVGGTIGTLNPQVRYYGPFITVCNSWNYWWTYLAEHFSEEENTGSAERALLNSAGEQKNSVGHMGATGPANGEEVERGAAQFLQGQPYTGAIDRKGDADCEGGQRGFLERHVPEGTPEHFRVALLPRTPGNQGPTYTGRPRVPEGQTFTHKPEIGVYAEQFSKELEGE